MIGLHAALQVMKRCVVSGRRAGPLLLVSACSASGGEVVGWRGDGTGLFVSAQPPLEWGAEPKKNILWKARIGKGYSSPVASGGRVFITAEEDKLLCIDAATGQVAWAKTNGLEELANATESKAIRPAGADPSLGPGPTNVIAKLPAKEAGYATATPVTDGQLVYACFGTGLVVCYDLAGQRRWVRHFVAPPSSTYGRAASPLLVEGRLLVVLGCLTALDPATGRTLWESKQVGESFATPAVMKTGATAVVFTGNGACVRVSDGAVLGKELGNSLYTTPVTADSQVYFIGPQTIAVRLVGKVEANPEFKRLWLTELEGEFFSSPVLIDGVLYAVSNEGMLSALETKTGVLLYQQHIDIPSQGVGPGVEPANIYPSLAVAAQALFLSNDKGDTLVLGVGREYKRIGVNTLEEGAAGSPAFQGKRVFLRGGESLYCIGAK